VKRLTIITVLGALLLSTGLPTAARAGQLQVDPTVSYYTYFGEPSIINGDTLQTVVALPVYVFTVGKGGKGQSGSARNDRDRARRLEEIQRLVYNVKTVYPIAKEANRKLDEVEAHLKTIPTKKAQEEYVKQVEKELKAQYTPVLENMTFSQGKILIKLIDRETSNTSYDLVKQLRGSFSAFFWQAIARVFGANLKDTYQRDGDDKIIEEIIQLYEAGLI